jgi:hypothetical protein
MAKPDCSACSILHISIAKLKPCWDKTRCHRRRSDHRHQPERSRKRSQTNQPEVIATTITVPDLWAAELCIWVDRHNNTIHAIGAKLWCGSNVVQKGRIQPIHLLGATQGKLELIAEHILLELCKMHSIELASYRTIREFDSSDCLLADCKKY